MGIELPAELADIAARTGVKWPAADEDKMREAAQAWRDTGQKITALISEADTTARTALSTTQGAGADSARQHWGEFVKPDAGHLTRIAKGCTANADKLDHAANQIGQAKVAIVRELTPLAKNVDVAERSGDPTALLGLDTAIKGAAANIANVQSTLVTAVQPASGVVMDTVEPIVNTNPGAHGNNLVDAALPGGQGPWAPVQEVVDPGGQGPLAPVHDAVSGVVNPGGQGPLAPVHDAVSGVVNPGGQGPLPPVAGVVDPGGHGPALPGVPGVVDPGGHGPGVLPGEVPGGFGPGHGSSGGAPGHGGPEPALPSAPGVVPPGGPSILPAPADPVTGPLPIIIDHDAITPPSGIQRPDHGVQIAGAAAVLDAPPPMQAPAHQASPAIPTQPPVSQAPAPGSPFVSGGGAPPPPQAPVPPPPAASAHPAAPPPPPQHVQAQQQAPRGPAPFAVTAEPVRQQTPQPVPMAAPVKPQQDEDSTIALWLVRMFPLGHMPVATARPARQLPPPPVEFDYAAGMRFEPHDHPESDLIDDTEALAWALEGGDAVTSGPPAPADNVIADHDPLAGQNERDWSRRFVVRAGTGRDTMDTEYAWPPSELFPEGATAPGEPGTLEPGTVIDRFGTPEGRVFAAADTSFAQRALPPSHLHAEYRRYRVLKPLPVWRGISAAWFGQTGGGVRYRTTHPALDLIALGYLAEETDNEG